MPYFAFDIFGKSCSGSANASSTCKATVKYDQYGHPINPVYHTLQITVDVLAIIAGITAVIMIIIAGLTMVTSQGNSEAVNTSRNRIIYAAVGLVIIAAAWSLVSLIIDHLAG